MNITDAQLDRMKHALGMDNKDADGFVYHAYRNSSVYDGYHSDWEQLCKEGLAERNVYGDEVFYHVTRKGMQAVADATNLTIRYTIECEPQRK